MDLVLHQPVNKGDPRFLDTRTLEVLPVSSVCQVSLPMFRDPPEVGMRVMPSPSWSAGKPALSYPQLWVCV
jgi:hypothetical protein